jgi:hypothetical protein
MGCDSADTAVLAMSDSAMAEAQGLTVSVDSKSRESGVGGNHSPLLSSFRWVQKHPLLATVIWVLGKVVPHAVEVHSPDSDSSGPSSAATSRGRLSWSDEHGGSLAEYMGEEGFSHVIDGQTKEERTGSKKQDKGGSGMPPPVPQNFLPRGPLPPLPPSSMASRSPDWGFYVTMTPPLDHYAASG